VKVHLDPASVKKLAVPRSEDRAILWDGTPSSPPQFGLRVRANGSRSFIVGYRTRTGTKRTMRVGTPRELTLADAREAARLNDSR